MKRQSILVLAMLILLGMTNIASADMMQPWTTTETSLFRTTDSLPSNTGSGWLNNNLILNYGVWDGSSGGDARSVTDVLQNFIPTDAIGISFGVSSNTQYSRIHVWAQEYSAANEFIFQQSVITLQNDMDFSGNVVSFGPGAISPIDYWYDIPESTLSGITTVDFIFIQDMIGAPFSMFSFAADGRGLAGTTTFSDVSWIIPAPPAILLGSIGLTFSGWLLRKRRMM